MPDLLANNRDILLLPWAIRIGSCTEANAHKEHTLMADFEDRKQNQGNQQDWNKDKQSQTNPNQQSGQQNQQGGQQNQQGGQQKNPQSDRTMSGEQDEKQKRPA
jgi:hypothetical protein